MKKYATEKQLSYFASLVPKYYMALKGHQMYYGNNSESHSRSFIFMMDREYQAFKNGEAEPIEMKHISECINIMKNFLSSSY